MNEQRLTEILARAEAAAPGPWESDGAEIYGTFAGVLSIDLWVGETLNIDDLEQANANASFIAAARTDVPELVTEVAALRARVAELEDYERLSPQQCPKGLHADWLVDSEYAHACPWCRVAELEAAAVCPSVARLYGSTCVLPVRHRGDHRDETKRHYWSDEYAAPAQPRQSEDPHTSELHHDYVLGRDDLAIPRQVTGRCPNGHTFEDCTCGGAA